MADSNNNGNQRQPQDDTSTISYLPILFANGYPTSLEKMTAEQLELFIPFLVKCSLNLKMDEEPKSAPKWWPHHLIEYKNPLEKPKHLRKKLMIDIMKTVVQKCYEYHNQPFLLKYSKDLSENDTANLRYVRDSNSTTALWSRDTKKLLLTFRNELMLYDKKKRRQLWKKDESQQEEVVDENQIDIFLCDYCDATFVSEEAYTDHEKRCNTNTEQRVENIVISDDEEDDNEVEDDDNLNSQMLKDQTDFMAYFYLVNENSSELPRRNFSQIERSLSPKKKKKQAPRTRKIISQKDREREFSVPFSSPAGIIMTKKPLDEEYIRDKVQDYESYCTAKPNSKVPTRNKFRYQQNSTDTYLMRAMRKIRPYYWPRRHLYSQSHQDNFEFVNRWLIEDCQPFSIILEKMTSESIQEYRDMLAKKKIEREQENCVDLISDSDDEDSDIEVKDCEFNEAMLKLNGNFLTMPISTAAMSSKSILKISNISSFPYSTSFLSDTEIKLSRRTALKIQQNKKNLTSLSVFQSNSSTETSSSDRLIQNGKLKRPNDLEYKSHDSKRTKNIHEWLNNVNGENFNQITHLINS